MRAVDTSIVVRLLMHDDTEQLERVTAMLRPGPVCVTSTVILETEWVLRRVYRLEDAVIALGLRGLFGLPGIRIDAEAAVGMALDWFEQGMDFADALHLASARHCDGFFTFDRDFIKAASRIGAGDVDEP
jgi:predicted nucleic-acid-binding protein